MAVRKLRGLDWVWLLLGGAMLANALWMLVWPMHWYTDLPAARASECHSRSTEPGLIASECSGLARRACGNPHNT